MGIEPETSDRPPRFRFSLAKLLLGLTLVSLCFGIVGVPITLYLAGWMAAMAGYFVVAERWGVFPAIVTFFALIWGIMIAMQAVHFGFR